MASLAPDPANDADATTGRLDAHDLQRRWRLVLPHREQMLRVARRRVDCREDAEDVVSTAMLRTVEHPGLDESRVGAFLCTTVIRLAVDVHRERVRQLAVGVRDAGRALPCTPVEETVCDGAEARWLAARLSDSPARERQVLAARVSGLSAQEVTAHLGLTAKSVENAFTRVRHRANALMAATLSLVAAVASYARRVARPALAAVPVAAITAIVAVTGGGAATPRTVAVDPGTAEVAAVRPARTVPAPARTTAARRGATPTSVRTGSAAPRRAVPVPTRTEVRVPAVVDRGIVDPGGVYVERRHEDETWAESIARCISSLDPDRPTADPCA